MALTYLVTGGAGFIGSHITELLISRGAHVRVFDNFSNGKLENLSHLPKSSLTVIKGDIRDEAAVREACKGVDFVSHQAALGSVPRSIKDPALVDEVNVHGTLNVLIASRDAGVRRVIFASSSSVYGGGTKEPIPEDHSLNPRSPYAVSKAAAELYCRVFYSLYNLETVILRYFNVFGTRQRADSPYAAVIPKFMNALLHDTEAEIHGTGDQRRSFTFVTNVAHANLRAFENPAEKVVGESFNIGGRKNVSIRELYGLLQTITNSEKPARNAPPREGDVQISIPDLQKTSSHLLEEEVISLGEGLKQAVEWYRTLPSS